MRDELYRDLVDVVTAISGRWVAPDTQLAEWHRWAPGFCAGLYCRRTAQRVAHTTWQYAMQAIPMSTVAYAAASAAWGVVHAVDGDELAAWLAIKTARDALGAIAAPAASVAAASPRPPSPRRAR